MRERSPVPSASTNAANWTPLKTNLETEQHRKLALHDSQAVDRLAK
jgi:hypothetical protein